MPLFDGIVLGFCLISALLAMVRGFSREILSIASWVLAAAAAFYLYERVLPFVQPHISNVYIAMAVSAAAVFIVALIIITLITMKIADFIIDSQIGALDRTLGFVYGLARGILVMALALLIFNWVGPEKRPDWVTNAKTRPFLERVGGAIQAVFPMELVEKLSNYTREGIGQSDDDAEPGQ